MVGTVSTTSTGDPSLENKLTTAITDTTISVLNTSINYTIYSPFFPPFFPPYFPPSFCSCIPGCSAGNITSVGVRQYGQYSYLDPAGYGWACDGTTSYEYWTCGCGAGACPAEGGYNGALREGVCGYTAPPPPPGGGGTPPPPPPIPPPAPGACDACGGGGGYGCVDLKGNGEFGCL